MNDLILICFLILIGYGISLLCEKVNRILEHLNKHKFEFCEECGLATIPAGIKRNRPIPTTLCRKCYRGLPSEIQKKIFLSHTGHPLPGDRIHSIVDDFN